MSFSIDQVFLHEHLDFRAGLIKQFEFAGIRVIQYLYCYYASEEQTSYYANAYQNKIQFQKLIY
jgi:hypothetical protein